MRNFISTASLATLILCSLVSCSRQQMKHVGEEYTCETAVISEENKLFGLVSEYCGFNKTPFNTYLNKDTIDIGQKRTIWCFDSLGRPILFDQCMNCYCDNLSGLLTGKHEVVRMMPLTIKIHKDTSGKKNTNVFFNHNLTKFLKKNDIRLLDNSRLTIGKLPKSKFYLFVEWYWIYPEEGYEVLHKMDSICAQNPQVTFVLVHNTNIKGTPVVLQ